MTSEKKEDPLFFLDLKRAEVAIASGRLGEAFRVLHTSSERSHRDGQRLVDRLVAAFVARATEHLTENRIDDARHDADNAQQLGGRTTTVAELRQKISETDAHRQQRQQRQQRRNDVLASAQQQMLAGAYSLGGKLLEGLDTGQSSAGAASKERLADSIEARRVIIDDAAARIQAATDTGDHETAVAMISGLQLDQQAHAKIVALIPLAVGPLVTRGLSELSTGRLDRAATMADILRPLESASPGVGELQQCLLTCRSARKHIEAHQFAEAEAQLAVLSQMVDGGTWIDTARNAIAVAIRELNSATAGPLGLLGDQLNQQQTSA
ncbi:MAG: hypothetical protein P8J37_15520, partial [Fuerstiella sp.]|nr:hypothetical protein [Fuerstiella sp.]